VKALCLQHGDEGVDMKETVEDEEVIRLLEQLQELRSQRAKEQRKISELEEQLAGLLQVKENFNTF
jgi:sialic acid synthase SpsE